MKCWLAEFNYSFRTVISNKWLFEWLRMNVCPKFASHSYISIYCERKAQIHFHLFIRWSYSCLKEVLVFRLQWLNTFHRIFTRQSKLCAVNKLSLKFNLFYYVFTLVHFEEWEKEWYRMCWRSNWRTNLFNQKQWNGNERSFAKVCSKWFFFELGASCMLDFFSKMLRFANLVWWTN